MHLVFPVDPVLFTDENLPADLTVAEGQSANFTCQALTLQNTHFFDASSVAFLVRAPNSSELTQCLSCSFSRSALTVCREMVDEGSCSGLQFFNSSFGHPALRTHNVTAHWSQVDMHHNGSEVVCAIAMYGVTQWAHTATLTVTPTPMSPDHGIILQERAIAHLTIGVVVLVLGSIATVSVVGLIIYRRRTYWYQAATDGNRKTFVKLID